MMTDQLFKNQYKTMMILFDILYDKFYTKRWAFVLERKWMQNNFCTSDNALGNW